jgi:hypothetical protein
MMGAGAFTIPRSSNDEVDDEEPIMILPVTETILGIPEAALVAMMDPHERNARFVRAEHHCFVNEVTGYWTSYGDFYTPTIASLRQRVAALVPKNKQPTKNKTTPPPPLSTRSGVDIGALQGTLTTSDQAMVQVASNFNCLENPSRRSRLDTGQFVDQAYLDCTQGPAAVFGTTSAYLYRCHFYQGGQSFRRRNDDDSPVVNLLHHTRTYFGTPHNGKLTLTGDETILQTEAQIDAAASMVCIGLHQDCPIMFGRTSRDVVYNTPQISTTSIAGQEVLEYPLVDHVLNASINLHDYGTSQQHDAIAIANLTRALLRAAYESVYLAAILRRRRKLYLTLVGGGCFGNPIAMIVEEIQRAHELYANHPASVLEECVICLFSRTDERSVRDAMT